MATHYDWGQMAAAMQVKPEETAQYGIFRLSGLRKNCYIPLSGVVEKPTPGTAPSSLAAVGRYIFDRMIFNVLTHTPYGAGGELQLTDAIAIATHAVPLTAFQFSGVRYDCGNHDGLLSASVARQACVRNDAVENNASQAVSVSASGETYAMVRRSDRDARSIETAACAHSERDVQTASPQAETATDAGNDCCIVTRHDRAA